MGREAKDQERLQLPQRAERKQAWIMEALQSSAKGLRKPGAALQALRQVEAMLACMRRGFEGDHLKWILQKVDARGADVPLTTGELSEPVRQVTPYLAPAWEWHSYHAYAWGQAQHINALEFIAFFHSLRSRSTSAALHG